MKEGYIFATNDTYESTTSNMKNLVPSITTVANTSKLYNEIGTYSNSKYNWESADNIDAAPYYAATELSLMLISQLGLEYFVGK
jgi:hypothetical protein